MSSLDRLDARTLLRLEADLSHHTLDEFVERIRRHFGLANSVYLCPSFPGRSLADPFFTATYSAEWVAHYRTQRYASIDPVINIDAGSVLPLDWARLPRRDKKVRRLFGEASDAGVGRQGWTIPVRGPTNGLWALFVATSDESDGEWGARRVELMRDIVLVAYYMHERAYELHAREAPLDLNAITRREIEALEWAAEGKSVEDTAVLMRISAVTVRAHLDSARHKLQALTRVHAIAKAIRAGLIH